MQLSYKPLPASSDLRRLFRYDRVSGKLFWKERVEAPTYWNTRYAGTEAGTVSSRDRYLRVSINKQFFLVHRVIFKMVSGFDPVGSVDHRDGDKGNNRYSNFRLATQRQNAANSANTIGKNLPKGVDYRKSRNKYRARVQSFGRQTSLGHYNTVEEAAAAYKRGAETVFGEFARCA